MSQTTTPSGTQLLNILQTMANTASLARWRDRTTEDSLTLLEADEYERVAVAAVSYLIARNAELEAERDALIDQRDAMVPKMLDAADRAAALAAENKALREALELLSSPSCSMTTHGATSYIGWQAGDGLSAQQRAEVGRAALARTPAKGNDSCDSAT